MPKSKLAQGLTQEQAVAIINKIDSDKAIKTAFYEKQNIILEEVTGVATDRVHNNSSREMKIDFFGETKYVTVDRSAEAVDGGVYQLATVKSKRPFKADSGLELDKGFESYRLFTA